MERNILLVVPKEKRGFFYPLKGPWEIVSEEEILSRLKERRKQGKDRVFLSIIGPEEFRKRVKDLLSGVPSPEVVFYEEDPFPALLSALSEGPPPDEIESRSMELIRELIDLSPFPPEAHPLILRLVHASGDPELVKTLILSREGVETGVSLLREGAWVVCDVEMVAAGIDRRRLAALGGRVLCAVREAGAPPPGYTRTAWGMERLLREHPEVGIVVVGNAPTALLSALRVLTEKPRRVLVVGFPVGFVRAAEAKLLLAQSPFPHLTNYGSRGGSGLAAAALNALLRLAHETA